VPGEGTLIEVDGAVGVHKVLDSDPESIGATWSELHRHVLGQVRISGTDAAGSMRRLLAAWRERLADLPVPEHGESTAVLSWPSRDAEVVKVLRDSGFTPTAVLAARTTSAVSVPAPQGVTVRPIRPEDAAAVVELHEALMRWDDNFGGAHWRPTTPARMRDFVAELIASPRPRSWVAEADGEILGICDVEWPETAAWATASVAADPGTAAYLGAMCVAPGRRGGGIGAALVSHVHREFEAAGIRTVVLHYAPLNPLSGPFWHRNGYRPVITTWKAQPHTVLRAD
jgi:GNAT superfamily N-acetyltransferase